MGQEQKQHPHFVTSPFGLIRRLDDAVSDYPVDADEMVNICKSK